MTNTYYFTLIGTLEKKLDFLKKSKEIKRKSRTRKLSPGSLLLSNNFQRSWGFPTKRREAGQESSLSMVRLMTSHCMRDVYICAQSHHPRHAKGLQSQTQAGSV